MEMNPFKPLIQLCEELYEQKICPEISLSIFSLKNTSIKTTF